MRSSPAPGTCTSLRRFAAAAISRVKTSVTSTSTSDSRGTTPASSTMKRSQGAARRARTAGSSVAEKVPAKAIRNIPVLLCRIVHRSGPKINYPGGNAGSHPWTNVPIPTSSAGRSVSSRPVCHPGSGGPNEENRHVARVRTGSVSGHARQRGRPGGQAQHRHHLGGRHRSVQCQRLLARADGLRHDQGRFAGGEAGTPKGRSDDRRAAQAARLRDRAVRKNHLGDRNEFLPTVHGFDEFYGNLYHLNAEEEPELPDYPKDPAFRAKFGPRGVMDCKASAKSDSTDDKRFGKVGKQSCKDTGPLTKARMVTI